MSRLSKPIARGLPLAISRLMLMNFFLFIKRRDIYQSKDFQFTFAVYKEGTLYYPAGGGGFMTFLEARSLLDLKGYVILRTTYQRPTSRTSYRWKGKNLTRRNAILRQGISCLIIQKIGKLTFYRNLIHC